MFVKFKKINLFAPEEFPMPVPKRKTSRSRRDKRSANKALKPQAMTNCLTCKAIVSPHAACSECGYYKGVKVFRTKEERREGRDKARQSKQAAMAGEKTDTPSATE